MILFQARVILSVRIKFVFLSIFCLSAVCLDLPHARLTLHLAYTKIGRTRVITIMRLYKKFFASESKYIFYEFILCSCMFFILFD